MLKKKHQQTERYQEGCTHPLVSLRAVTQLGDVLSADIIRQEIKFLCCFF